MSIERNFKIAGDGLSLVRLTDNDGNVRIGQPYMIFKTKNGIRALHFYQIEGYSKESKSDGWKIKGSDVFRSCEVLETLFSQNSVYNPMDRKRYPEVYWSIPTLTGERRDPDLVD